MAGRASVLLPENMLGVIERCALKPFIIRHFMARDLGIRRVVFNFEEFPEAFPEIGNMIGAPLPEGVVVLEIQVFFFGQPLGIAREVAVVERPGDGCQRSLGIFESGMVGDSVAQSSKL